MAETPAAPDDADLRGFVDKLQRFRSSLSTSEQAMFDNLTAAASSEVEGFFFQAFNQAWGATQRGGKTKVYDFSADTIEGDLVKPEGTDLNVN